VALHDAERCLQLLEVDDRDTDQAPGYLESQVLGAYVGEGMPVFAVVCRPPVPGELLGYPGSRRRILLRGECGASARHR
jgi:hypothetical protein